MCDLCHVEYDWTDVDSCTECKPEECEDCKLIHADTCECRECMKSWTDSERETHCRRMNGIVQRELSIHVHELFQKTTHCLVGDYEWGPKELNRSHELRLICVSCGERFSVGTHGVAFGTERGVCGAMAKVEEVMES
jgi:hypothetical protein